MRVRTLVEASYWSWLAAIWLSFWLGDLRHARAGVLILVPVVAGVAGAAVFAWRGLRTGLLAGLAVIWIYFGDRAAGTGCTGVSSAYDTMLVGTGAALVLAPFLYLRWDDPRL